MSFKGSNTDEGLGCILQVAAWALLFSLLMYIGCINGPLNPNCKCKEVANGSINNR